MNGYIMRSWINLIEHSNMLEFIRSPAADDADPYFTWHITGSIAYIDNLVLDPKYRGVGKGTEIYRQWESRLPSHIKSIKLWSKNTKASKFWKKQGFVNKLNYVADDGSESLVKDL